MIGGGIKRTANEKTGSNERKGDQVFGIVVIVWLFGPELVFALRSPELWRVSKSAFTHPND